MYTYLARNGVTGRTLLEIYGAEQTTLRKSRNSDFQIKPTKHSHCDEAVEDPELVNSSEILETNEERDREKERTRERTIRFR